MDRKLPHLRILSPNETLQFTTPQSGGGSSNYPQRDRAAHGELIQQKLEQAWQQNMNDIAVSHSTRQGAYIEFQSKEGFDIKSKSLEDTKKGIRLCNIREEINNKDDNTKEVSTFITVYIPNKKKNAFFDKITKYLEEETTGGNPRNKELIEGIENLQNALNITSFWTDNQMLIPEGSAKEWCEVWLRDSENTENQFNVILENLGIESKSDMLRFPERIVKLIYVSKEDLANLIKHSDDIAEFRAAKSTAYFFLSETPAEQSKWVEELLQRLSVNNINDIAICLLDTGVNNGHPLLNPLLSVEDCQSVDTEWETNDHQGHGTLMSGILGYGNLQYHLESSNQVVINHQLESVKILPNTGENPKELWGEITKQAISKAEIQAEDRKRVICMPVSAEDTRDQGRPSSWSGAVDQITSGVDDDQRRLVILAAGNNLDQQNWLNYPNANLTETIHDPAQSWNAVTVGAITELQTLEDTFYANYMPVANNGELSPFSTTSLIWDNKWPIKPEVVFEGGNLAINANGSPTECDDLSLVSTFHKPSERLFRSVNMTSAATALAANFAAQLQAEYPEYWPETIRALMVHSAEWSDAIKRQLTDNNSKAEFGKLLRCVGYGKPDLQRALYCAENSLTLIAEANIQPFEKVGSRYKTKDMHLYQLPWPKEILENLGEANVEMRITLSYFIEPGPGEIGWKDRYRYASHGLRFDLNSPAESKDEFIKRINKNAREEDENSSTTQSPSSHWFLGSKNRDKGSIHSDIWSGTAAELASSNLIAISPRIGWWRERTHLKKFDSRTRYSLIVSISTPENEVDIYTPVRVAIERAIPITIQN